MLFDGLVSFDLPARPGPATPDRGVRSLENLLFEGSPRVRHAECSLSAAAVLSRCYDATRALGARRFAVGSDADELFEIPAVREAGEVPRWPELLPPRWTELPAGFWIRGQFSGGGVVGVVHLRYSPRFRVHEGALNGSLRLLWDVGPRAGAERFFGQDLRASLEGEAALRSLARRLESWGAVAGATLLQHLRASFGGHSGASWGRVVVLHRYVHRPDRFRAVLEGFDPVHLQHLPLLDDRLRGSSRSWPALSADGVPGRTHNGTFVPVLEESHAV